LVALLIYGGGAAALSVAGNYLAVIMWLNLDEYENTKTHVNKLTDIQGYKYLVVGIIIAAGGWIAALGLGQQATNIFGIFDSYNTSADLSGSSLFIDINLHLIGSLFNYLVLLTIAAGGYITGIAILGTELNFSVGV